MCACAGPLSGEATHHGLLRQQHPYGCHLPNCMSSVGPLHPPSSSRLIPSACRSHKSAPCRCWTAAPIAFARFAALGRSVLAARSEPCFACLAGCPLLLMRWCVCRARAALHAVLAATCCANRGLLSLALLRLSLTAAGACCCFDTPCFAELCLLLH